MEEWKWNGFICFFILSNLKPSRFHFLVGKYEIFKGATIRAVSKWEGIMITLPVCYTQLSILTVLYVVCYRNANNSSGYVSLMWSMFEIIQNLAQAHLQAYIVLLHL